MPGCVAVVAGDEKAAVLRVLPRAEAGLATPVAEPEAGVVVLAVVLDSGAILNFVVVIRSVCVEFGHALPVRCVHEHAVWHGRFL